MASIADAPERIKRNPPGDLDPGTIERMCREPTDTGKGNSFDARVRGDECGQSLACERRSVRVQTESTHAVASVRRMTDSFQSIVPGWPLPSPVQRAWLILCTPPTLPAEGGDWSGVMTPCPVLFRFCSARSLSSFSSLSSSEFIMGTA